MSVETTRVRTSTAADTELPSFQSAYQSRLTTAEEAMAQVANGSTMAMGLSPCQPPGAAAGAGRSRAQAKNINGVKVYYSVSGRHLRNTILRFEHLRRFEPYCLFFGATERELAARARAEGRGQVVNYVPNFFFELDRCIPEHRTVDTFMTTVAPMDEEGYFSFGTNSDYSLRHCRGCSTRDRRRGQPAHAARCAGRRASTCPRLRRSSRTTRRSRSFRSRPPKELDPLIARNVVELIPDGATLQMGIGSLPSVVCSVLDRHNDLGIHTELLTPPMATLMEAGRRQQPMQEARHRQDGLHVRARRSPALRVHERPSRRSRGGRCRT